MTGAGDLDQYIVFEAPTVFGDGFGGGPVTWGEHARAWARVKPVRGDESERQGAQRLSQTYMIEVYTDGLAEIGAQMRIRWQATAYNDVLLNIREIRRPPHRHALMTIIAEGGVTQ